MRASSGWMTRSRTCCPSSPSPQAGSHCGNCWRKHPGLGSLKSLVDVKQDPRMTLAESAAEIARRPLEDPPGQVFKYGGPGFQVAGALVEAATGRRWADLFAERIARPLGMTHTYWEHLPARGVSPADTRNPLLQGGVVTTADDYIRFLEMLARRGMLSPAIGSFSTGAVDAMETVQTLGKPTAYLPPGARAGDAICAGKLVRTRTDGGGCTLVSSPGAFGTYPCRSTGRAASTESSSCMTGFPVRSSTC